MQKRLKNLEKLPEIGLKIIIWFAILNWFAIFGWYDKIRPVGLLNKVQIYSKEKNYRMHFRSMPYWKLPPFWKLETILRFVKCKTIIKIQIVCSIKLQVISCIQVFHLHANCLLAWKFLACMINAMKTKNLYGSYPKKIIYQNSDYKVHQVSPRDFGSQNFSSLPDMV
jgi:hypothetical protein